MDHGCASSSGACGGQGECRQHQPATAIRNQQPDQPSLQQCCRCDQPSKIRYALRYNEGVCWNDRVLMALSGGPSSWLALHVLLSLHAPGSQYPGKGKVPFELGVVHIQEQPSTATSITEWMQQHAPHIPLLLVPLHDALRGGAPACQQGVEGPPVASGEPSSTRHPPPQVPSASASSTEAPFSEVSSAQAPSAQAPSTEISSAQDPAAALALLLGSVRDVTAREDLTHHLCTHLLHRTALVHGYSKLVLGDTSTTAAVQVIAAACKGQGNVLSSLVAPYDARLSQLAVVRPMQSVSAKEASLLAHRLALPCTPPPLPTAPRRSINQLAEGFVVNLQQAMPSAVATITKTAGKLQGFAWNAPPTKRTSGSALGEAPPLCVVCTAPLHDTEDAWACRSCMLGLFGDLVGSGDEEEMGVLAARVAEAVGLDGAAGGVQTTPAMLRKQVEAYLL